MPQTTISYLFNDTFLTGAVDEILNRSPAANDVNKKNHQRDDKQQVDKTTANMRRKTE
jgi:hypothetical protein